MATGLDLGLRTFAIEFFLPLLISPLCAATMAALGFPLLSRAFTRVRRSRDRCLCVEPLRSPIIASEGVALIGATPGLRVLVDRRAACAPSRERLMLGFDGRKLLDGIHLLSAGAVCFARALNDTPKIVALGLLAGGFGLKWSIAAVALIMSIGGLFHSRKVAETVSKRITAMEPDQGLLANLVTSFLVISASKWGMPLSTTQVSCGALFGIGIASGQARWSMIRTIVLAWLLTLPTAALLSAGIYSLLRSF
jgi:PiT family inorganic phosphate transporter